LSTDRDHNRMVFILYAVCPSPHIRYLFHSRLSWLNFTRAIWTDLYGLLWFIPLSPMRETQRLGYGKQYGCIWTCILFPNLKTRGDDSLSSALIDPQYA